MTVSDIDAVESEIRIAGTPSLFARSASLPPPVMHTICAARARA